MNTGDRYKDQKILILGLGVNQGGLGATRFFAKAGAQVKVTDLKSKEELQASIDQLEEFPEIEYILGEHRFEDLDWADLIIKNPALRPDNKYLVYARESGKQVETDMGIFLEFVEPIQVIGITGTKGKSTTSSLIHEVLKSELGEKVLFAGNIGKSVLDTIEHLQSDSLIVLELSSFQLEGWDQHSLSPHISLVTNIMPDHLNYYGTMENYIAAKRPIALYQNSDDFLLIYADNETINSDSFLEGCKGQIIKFSSSDLPNNFTPILPGDHNRANIAGALAVAKLFKIPQNQALTAINQFKGVEFRQQLIKEWQGVKFYNDTAATGPDATISALKSFPGAIFIVGGMNKNLPYHDLAHELPEFAKAIYLIEGDATEEIKKSLPSQDKIKGEYNNFDEMLEDIKKSILPGDTVILSPAAASFNLFQNEFDRGRKFNAAVEKIFN